MSVTLANSGAVDRSRTDFYPTPEEVTAALLLRLKIPYPATIWEPAAGEGHMSKVFRDFGYSVIEDDLHTYSKQDFRNTSILKAPWIITNPPFMHSEEFIRHSLSLRPDGVAMLLKSQYWHSSKRRVLFTETKPKYIIPLTWRPDFLFGAKSSSPTMEVLWTVWEKDHNGACIYDPVAKPKRNMNR